MSRDRGQRIINLETTDRVGLHYAIEHPGFLKDFTGIDPAEDLSKATVEAIRKMDADVVGGIPQSTEEKPFTEDKSARMDDRGFISTQWGYGSTPWYESKLTDFPDDEAVLNYNPLKKCLLPWRSDHLREYQSTTSALGQLAYPTCPGYLFTLVTHCSTVFGWEKFLTASALYPDKFEKLLERIGEYTLLEIEQMLKTESSICWIHDDVAMTKGLILSPQWMRRYAIPWYERFFDKIKKAGKKIWFESEGNYSDIVDDLIAIGADGLYMEQFSMDLEWMIKKCSGKTFLVAALDQNALSFDSPDAIAAQTKKHLSLAKRAPGHFLSLSVPHDVPLPNIYAFLKTFESDSWYKNTE